MGLSLQFIGCGDAFGSGGRFNTCFHLVGERTNLLIDCGASSLVAMKQFGIERNAITTMVITHFHADHFGGIPFFILDAQFFSKRCEPLTIVGPIGLEAWYERVMETAFPGSSQVAQKFALHLVEIAAGESAPTRLSMVRQMAPTSRSGSKPKVARLPIPGTPNGRPHSSLRPRMPTCSLPKPIFATRPFLRI
jgi:ribonuclease BN (tRNA processing enzyme)